MSGMKERLSQLGVELEQLQGEEEILTAAENGNWTEALHLAKHLGHPMNRGAANLYLEYALQNAPCKEFNQILSWVPKGEYTGMAKGITDHGELIVVPTGSERAVLVANGEISVRGVMGYV